jgi:hypothetical protein
MIFNWFSSSSSLPPGRHSYIFSQQLSQADLLLLHLLGDCRDMDNKVAHRQQRK